MNFIEKIIDGFNKVLGFLGGVFGNLFDFIYGLFENLINFLAKPLSYLFYFLEGVFYFITKLFEVAVLVIKIFVALFQFLGALVVGLMRTISSFLNVKVSGGTTFPSASNQGFAVVMDILHGLGFLTVVPMVATFFLWFFFIVKIISLVGGKITISPGGK